MLPHNCQSSHVQSYTGSCLQLIFINLNDYHNHTIAITTAHTIYPLIPIKKTFNDTANFKHVLQFTFTTIFCWCTLISRSHWTRTTRGSLPKIKQIVDFVLSRLILMTTTLAIHSGQTIFCRVTRVQCDPRLSSGRPLLSWTSFLFTQAK